MAASTAIAELEAAVQSRARGLGAHYTPHEVAERAARTVLAPACVGLSANEALGLRVLDPAVGSGRFLVAALDVLAEARGDGGPLRRLIASQCLYGVDVDPRAVALARRALAEAAGCSAEELRGNIVVGDSLLGDPAQLLGVGAFDAVIGNPPWISYSGRQAGAIEVDRRRRLAARFASLARWPTTHGVFLELAARLLRPGGRAALVLPHQVCYLPGYEAARRAVLASCCFEPAPEPLGEDCFPGVVQPAAIVYLHHSRQVAQASLRLRSGQACLCRHDDVTAGILAKMRRHPPAPPGTFRDPGVHTGNSAALLLYDAPGDGRVPIREGRCVHPFRLDPPSRWLDAQPRLPEGFYYRVGRPDTYLKARILIRQTANRPIAARHTEPGLFRNSVLACYGIPGLDDAALLGLLNSSALAFYHRCCHPDSGQRAFPQVKVAHLSVLPIARGAGELVGLVRRIEALAAAGREPELREARDALDAAVARLYGLTASETHCVERGAPP